MTWSIIKKTFKGSEKENATNGNRMLKAFSCFCFIFKYKIKYNSENTTSYINITLMMV